jgi:hypothetical protein
MSQDGKSRGPEWSSRTDFVRIRRKIHDTEKLIVTQTTNKFSLDTETNFIILLIKILDRIQSQFYPAHDFMTFFLRFTLILSPHLRLFPTDLFSLSFPTKID